MIAYEDDRDFEARSILAWLGPYHVGREFHPGLQVAGIIRQVSRVLIINCNSKAVDLIWMILLQQSWAFQQYLWQVCQGASHYLLSAVTRSVAKVIYFIRYSQHCNRRMHNYSKQFFQSFLICEHQFQMCSVVCLSSPFQLSRQAFISIIHSDRTTTPFT